jgi:type IV pilus assembly protein PilC
MIRAGISIRAALEGIADQTENPGFREDPPGIKNDVESGKQFSEAIAPHPKLFNPLYVNMVRASEMSGSFAKMLDRIAAYIGQQIETRKMVIGAMIYPGIIATMAVGVTVFLLTFVLPKFGAVFKGKEDVLPWPTLFLMGLRMVSGGGRCSAAVSSSSGLWLFSKTRSAAWLDKSSSPCRSCSRMFRALYISRSLQTMGELVNAGVPMLDTLPITGDISGNQLYKKMWRRVHASSSRARRSRSRCRSTSLLPKAVVQMIAPARSPVSSARCSTRSRSFTRGSCGQHQGRHRHDRADHDRHDGWIVGFIAMAIILPIFKMSSEVRSTDRYAVVARRASP